MLIRHRPLGPIAGLSLDLDDTLWDNTGVVAAAELEAYAWLQAHAPGLAARYSADSLHELYPEAAAAEPRCAYDMTALRMWVLRTALDRAGADPALAGPAFEVFHAARHRLPLAPGLPGLLARLAARWPLAALSNGNVRLARLGLDRFFLAQISPAEAGAAKPDAAIFRAGCAALGLGPERVLHVGDHLRLDVAAAQAAGMPAAWFNPRGLPNEGLVEPELELSALDELLDL